MIIAHDTHGSSSQSARRSGRRRSGVSWQKCCNADSDSAPSCEAVWRGNSRCLLWFNRVTRNTGRRKHRRGDEQRIARARATRRSDANPLPRKVCDRNGKGQKGRALHSTNHARTKQFAHDGFAGEVHVSVTAERGRGNGIGNIISAGIMHDDSIYARQETQRPTVKNGDVQAGSASLLGINYKEK